MVDLLINDLRDIIGKGDVNQFKDIFVKGIVSGIKLCSSSTKRQEMMTFFSEHSSLLTASRYGHSETVSMFIENGCDIEEKDGDGNTSLIVASRDGHESCLYCCNMEHKLR